MQAGPPRPRPPAAPAGRRARRPERRRRRTPPEQRRQACPAARRGRRRLRPTAQADGVDRALGHHLDQVGAVLGAGVEVRVQPVGGHLEPVERLGGEVLGQRVLGIDPAERRGPGTGDRHPHGAAGPGDVDADHRVAAGRVGELHVGALVGLGEVHRGDDLVAAERGLEHAGEEVVGRDLALVGAHGGPQRQQRARIVGGRVVVADRAADGAAVAHLRVADQLGQRRQRRDHPLDHGRARHVGMPGHRTDGDAAGLLLDRP